MDSVAVKGRLSNPDWATEGQESAWVTASRQGDSLAFNRLVLKWEKSIYNLTLRMLRDPDEAAEAAQEVFMSAYRNIKRFRHDARFSTWLYRIAVNHCISRLRKRPPGVHYSLDDHAPDEPERYSLPVGKSHEEELLREETQNRVRSALLGLAPEQRAVVELKFFQELTFEEISQIMQAPLSTVKSRLYSGLDTLKVKLAGVSPEA